MVCKSLINVVSVCFSTISLVSKSAMPAFRMHLRAHGTITKIFSALQDAPDYPVSRTLRLTIDHLSVTSHTLPHAASGSDKDLGEPVYPPTTRDPVAQAPTTVKGEYN